MKVLEPKITCLMMVHGKPTIREALESVNMQSADNFELVIIDSGVWINSTDPKHQDIAYCYSMLHAEPRVSWYMTGELKDARKVYCPVSHWTNKAIELGLIRGKYFCTFYDDDIYYPDFLEKMSSYLDAHPDINWVRCTENRVQILPDGTKKSTPALEARQIIEGKNFDCVVDGMQVMYRTEVLNKVPQPIMDENPDWNSCSHSDGIMLNRLSEYFGPMHYIEEALCEHHNTVYSTFTPTS